MLIVALFSTLFFDDNLGGRLYQVVTIGTAIVGAVALFVQFKRDKDINQASFILEFWKNFSDQEDLQKIILKCDAMRLSEENKFVKSDYVAIVKYAQWLETLSSVINRKVVTFDAINDMYNYIFFVFTNNPYIQQTELEPNKQYYNGIYTAYTSWVNYLKKKNKPILCENTALIKNIIE